MNTIPLYNTKELCLSPQRSCQENYTPDTCEDKYNSFVLYRDHPVDVTINKPAIVKGKRLSW